MIVLLGKRHFIVGRISAWINLSVMDNGQRRRAHLAMSLFTFKGIGNGQFLETMCFIRSTSPVVLGENCRNEIRSQHGLRLGDEGIARLGIK